MKIKSIRVKGTVPSPGELVFDAASIGDAAIVAIIGPNGVGKSALLETVPGVAYRSMPSRGSVAEIATGPDTELDVILETDHVFGLHLNIDGSKVPRTMAGYVNDGPRRPGEKAWAVTKYDAEVAKLLPPKSIYLASAFGSQKGTGRFLDAAPAERRSILAELIGAGRWQEKSVAAGKKLREVQTERIRLEAERDAAAKRIDDKAFENVVEARGCLEVAQSHVDAEEKMNVARKQKRAEYDAQIADLKAQEAALLEKGKALRAAYDLDCANRARDWGAREDRRRLDFNAAVSEGHTLAKAQTDLFSAEHKAWKDRRDARKRDLDAATREVERLLESAERLGKVPCGGNGEFAACPLIASAVAAKEAVFEAARKRNELAAIPDEPEPMKATETPEILAARKKQELLAVAEPEPTKPAEPPEIATARGSLLDVRAKMQGRIEPDAEPDLAPLRAKSDSYARELARLGEVARQSEAAKAEAEAAGAKIAAVTVEEDDWTALQKACSGQGIQAFLIDAAAPEISGIANDLLRETWGTRFAVNLVTVAAKADGKGTKEICDLSILDNERGVESSAAMKSGGERALLSEILSIAIAIFNSRRSAIPIRDLVRDETDKALDAENRAKYIVMIRRALKIGNFERCYIVTHFADMIAACDARVRLGQGKIEVEAA